MYYVYKHTNKLNHKVYIGITGRKPYIRWAGGSGYKPKSSTQSAYFYNAILKYGWDAFTHEVLYSGLTKEQAEAKEIELISEYRSDEREFGYNIEHGGNSTGRLSLETKAKIAQTWIETKSERSRKISESRKGCKFTDEHKRRLSEAKKGKKAPNRRAVNQYDLNMNFIKHWDSLEDAQRELKICKANICRAIRFDRTAGGYKWRY